MLPVAESVVDEGSFPKYIELFSTSASERPFMLETAEELIVFS